jgi:hypothetical protein
VQAASSLDRCSATFASVLAACQPIVPVISVGHVILLDLQCLAQVVNCHAVCCVVDLLLPFCPLRQQLVSLKHAFQMQPGCAFSAKLPLSGLWYLGSIARLPACLMWHLQQMFDHACCCPFVW